jgi:transposase
VLADKGYLARSAHDLAAELGIEARIPFKSNSTGKGEGSAAWRKAFYRFQAHQPEFLAAYHKRSNVESAFSAIKRKFGEHVRSRTPVAQVNEIRCKLICYNLTVVVHEMFENGIAPAFSP